MGAQITLLRGNASVPHPLLLRNEAHPYLLSGELCTSPLHSNPGEDSFRRCDVCEGRARYPLRVTSGESNVAYMDGA